MKKDGTEYRKRIIKMDLLRAIDDVGISERNKELIQRYVQGENYVTLTQAYNVSRGRIPQLIGRYIQISTWHLIRKEAKEGAPLKQLEKKYEHSAEWIENKLLWDKREGEIRLNKLYGVRKRKEMKTNPSTQE